jgi:hypothetical protein
MFLDRAPPSIMLSLSACRRVAASFERFVFEINSRILAGRN